jgi:sulfite reductase (NADPH) hemoprotein beta-component
MAQATETQLTPVEGIKKRSNFLRGTIIDGLADAHTGALAEDDTQLTKFHGFYQQDDRDLRNERARQKLEPAYSFMIRVRVPGGIATPQQWLALDALARQHANGTLRITTRQAFQFHGVIKSKLKATMRGINDSLLDTIAACGDVNRNVMCTPLDERSNVHAAACAIARDISTHLTPNTTAYHEIWLDGKKIAGHVDSEPLYGPTYLPRKFKIGVVIPPSNDVDVLSQDLGFIAIEQRGELAGFNVAVGGGMGMTHGDDKTYPRVGDVIGFCSAEQAVDVAEKVVAIQRDNGDRTNRKHARLKYTIDDRGLDWFVSELHQRLGYELQESRPFAFVS